MIRVLLVITFILPFLFGFEKSSTNETLKEYEQEMVAAQNAIKEGKTDDDRQIASDSFREILMNVLDFEGCFDYPFEAIKTMSILTSPDGKFRIFNWNVPREDESHKYYCFILHFNKKDKSTNWEELLDEESEGNNITNKYLKTDNWFGCLYYEIIPIKESKNKTSYTLLGWDGNNRSSTKKIIDAITFDNRKTRLGAPIFKSEKGTQKRYIIEYSSDVVVSLRWHEKDKRIVFDHVAPKDPFMTGVFSQYGPDLTYDAFVLEKNKWVFQSNVEVTNPKNNQRYNDPRPR